MLLPMSRKGNNSKPVRMHRRTTHRLSVPARKGMRERLTPRKLELALRNGQHNKRRTTSTTNHSITHSRVRFNTPERVLFMDVQVDDTTEDVQKKLEQMTAVQADSIRLSYKGAVLQQSHKVLPEGKVVSMTIDVVNDIQYAAKEVPEKSHHQTEDTRIRVLTPQGRMFVDVSSDVVADIARAIHAPAQSFHITFRNVNTPASRKTRLQA